MKPALENMLVKLPLCSQMLVRFITFKSLILDIFILCHFIQMRLKKAVHSTISSRLSPCSFRWPVHSFIILVLHMCQYVLTPVFTLPEDWIWHFQTSWKSKSAVGPSLIWSTNKTFILTSASHQWLKSPAFSHISHLSWDSLVSSIWDRRLLTGGLLQ